MDFNPEYAYRALKLIQYLVPKDVIGKNLVRIGNAHEGGYTMLDNFEGVSKAFSVGIGLDWSFDSALTSRNIKVYMFDHTIPTPPLKNPLLKFYKYGIHHEKVIEKNLITLKDMIALDKNEEDTNLILKMDVEGAEWEVLSKSSELQCFSHIVLELHWFKDVILSRERYLLALSALKKLNQTHQLVWAHGITSYGIPTANLNFGGVPLVNQIEVSYVRKDKWLHFVDRDTKRKRVNERNCQRLTETLMWWVEGGNNIDFEGLLEFYKDMIRNREKSVAFEEEISVSTEL